MVSLLRSWLGGDPEQISDHNSLTNQNKAENISEKVLNENTSDLNPKLKKVQINSSSKEES